MWRGNLVGVEFEDVAVLTEQVLDINQIENVATAYSTRMKPPLMACIRPDDRICIEVR